MHEEQNNAPVKTVQSNRQEANFPNLEEKENLKQFYLTQSRRLCPTVSVDRSELQRLGALHHKIKHFINDIFAQQAQLKKAGVGIAVQIALCELACFFQTGKLCA